VEDEEDWLVFLCVILLLNICLMLGEQFRVEFDIARLVDTMDIAEASSDAEIGGDLDKGRPDVVDVFGLGIERVVVNILVVHTIFLTAGDADFL
jgi:hypothetical protein